MVACTGDITKANIDLCRRVGFDSFLEKPVPNKKLDVILKKVLWDVLFFW